MCLWSMEVVTDGLVNGGGNWWFLKTMRVIKVNIAFGFISASWWLTKSAWSYSDDSIMLITLQLFILSYNLINKNHIIKMIERVRLIKESAINISLSFFTRLYQFYFLVLVDFVLDWGRWIWKSSSFSFGKFSNQDDSICSSGHC